VGNNPVANNARPDEKAQDKNDGLPDKDDSPRGAVLPNNMVFQGEGVLLDITFRAEAAVGEVVDIQVVLSKRRRSLL